MKLYITNCNDCPLCNNDNEYGFSCNYPGSLVEEYEMNSYDSTIPPEKCPLIKDNITIELIKENKNG